MVEEQCFHDPRQPRACAGTQVVSLPSCKASPGPALERSANERPHRTDFDSESTFDDSL